MAEMQVDTSDESFNDGGQEADKKDGSNASLERKDSLKLKTMKKHGHLRVKEDGQLTYKRTPSSALMLAIQLGIGYSVGRLTAKQERDILMQDFSFVEKVWFPSSGSRETPSHRFQDFKFKSYAPSAFRYFRDLFGMHPSEFLMALSTEELRELSNPGASGSLFFLSADDNFIIKTVQHKEATFLQQLLPGYYMNIHQNPRSFLPKFFGLYCYQSQNVNIRLVVMNNILKSTFRCHQLYDLKGSTFKRKASKAELAKKTPTKKDLDFRNDYAEGITLEADLYDAVIKTIKRDCRVLESFKIMDYSLLLGIHNMDYAEREKDNTHTAGNGTEEENPERIARREEFGAALEAIQIDKEGRPLGGIPATSPKGDRLILFIGVIDILQSYRLGKKLEHGWKSLIHDGDSVSVHNPSFYARRFISFMAEKVFKRASPAGSRGVAKKRSHRGRTTGSESFIDPGPPPTDAGSQKSKEGKQKVVSVKFSEEAIVYDSDAQNQMVPPPYEAQSSMQKEAGTASLQTEGDNDVFVTTVPPVESTTAMEGGFTSETAFETTTKIVSVKGSIDIEAENEAKSNDVQTENEAGANDAEAENKTNISMGTTSSVTEITVEDYLAARANSTPAEDASLVAENSEIESRGPSHVPVSASSATSTVTYSNSFTVVTSTISHETVRTRQGTNEAVAVITQSNRAEEGDFPAANSRGEPLSTGFELKDERNGVSHITIETKALIDDNSLGYAIKDGADNTTDSDSSSLQVTNIDTLIEETVSPTEIKVEVPVDDSYEVNGVMVTKI